MFNRLTYLVTKHFHFLQVSPTFPYFFLKNIAIFLYSTGVEIFNLLVHFCSFGSNNHFKKKIPI